MKKTNVILLISAILGVVAVLAYMHYRQMQKSKYDGMSDQELLDAIIAKNSDFLSGVAEKYGTTVGELNYSWFMDQDREQLIQLLEMCTCDFSALMIENFDAID